MAKDIEIINIGIVGHIDHGKTTLLHRLSGRWTSTHSEELKRGITIKLGYADTVIYKDNSGYNINKKGAAVRYASFVDAPGHEMLMATMLSGAAIIDAGILVIAANEGIKPQTREHLMALEAKKVKGLIVVQNKIDLVDEERAKKSYDEIKELLKGKFDNAEIIPVSAQQGVNIKEVLRAIAELEIPKRDISGSPVFAVARSFDINKPGTVPEELKGAVLGGALKQGILKINDKIEIKPGIKIKEGNEVIYKAIETKVKRLFRSSHEVKELIPGGSASIETELDMSLAKSDALSGNVVSISGKLPEITYDVKVKFNLFKEIAGAGKGIKVENIKTQEMLMLSVGTSITGGAVKSLKEDEISISLKIPVVVFQGDTVGIARNINEHWRLIGYGKII